MHADVGEGKKLAGKNIPGIPDMSYSARPTRVSALTVLGAFIASKCSPSPSLSLLCGHDEQIQREVFVVCFPIHQKQLEIMTFQEVTVHEGLDQNKSEPLKHSSVLGY